jgi:fucose 4-O-acetylase-like acetyltransferase
MPASIDFLSSQKFRFWLFASMILLLFVHSYNLHLRYLQPFSIVDERLTVNSFIQYFLSNGLFRFFIPVLFSISGYLYAAHDDRSYKKSISRRFRTIVVPYLVWSSVGLAITYILELSAYSRQIVRATQLLTLPGNRVLIHDYKWYELLLRWIVLPVSYQLWFLRVLFIYNLAYPALRRCIVRHTKIFFVILFLFWLSDIGFVFVEGEGLLFFSIGIWVQKANISIQQPGKWFQPAPWAVIFLLVTIIKTILAFKAFMVIGNSVFPLLLVLHKIAVLSGYIAAWFGSCFLVTWCMRKRWFVWLSQFSFVIFGLHAPLIAYAINAILPQVSEIDNYRLLIYALLPIGLFIFCIVVGAMIRGVFPGLFKILTGERGI